MVEDTAKIQGIDGDQLRWIECNDIFLEFSRFSAWCVRSIIRLRQVHEDNFDLCANRGGWAHRLARWFVGGGGFVRFDARSSSRLATSFRESKLFCPKISTKIMRGLWNPPLPNRWMRELLKNIYNRSWNAIFFNWKGWRNKLNITESRRRFPELFQNLERILELMHVFWRHKF